MKKIAFFNSFFVQLFISVFILSLISCRSNKNVGQSAITEQNSADHTTQMAQPAVIIYKTTKDYSQNVPVTMNKEKTMIISFPDVKDVYFQGKLAIPTQLPDGFLLDNRGIGGDIAFLSYTYPEYAALETTPTPEQLLKHIIDSNPIDIMYSCRCERDSAIISGMILNGEFDKFSRIK
jgi:hypothetical protein